ncbi:MAG: hypothetical protein P1Q69_11060 [Candidatus Thorarchaeota archaeon]|nr:hypothetical protein [Candidatus Thorarchaeota archaeon]
MQGVDWGYVNRVPIIGEGGSRTYKEVDRTQFWIRKGGLKIFKDFWQHLTAEVVKERCMSDLVPRLPVSPNEIHELWEKIDSEVQKDKEVFYSIVVRLRLATHPIIEAILRPLDDREEVAFPDKQTVLRRVEEKMGIRIDEGLLESLGWDSVLSYDEDR